MARPRAHAPVAYSDHDRLLARQFVIDFRFWAERVARVKHRNQPSRLVPLTLNPKQASLHRTFERARALNVIRNVRGLGLQKKALELFPQLEIDTDEIGYSQAITNLTAFHVSRFLHEAREKDADFAGLHDGPLRLLLGKYRRAGVSTYVEARLFHEGNFTPNLSMNVTAHTGETSANVFDMTRDMYRFWPNELLRFREVAETDAKTGTTWANGSKVAVHTASGKDQARSFGFDRTHLSEYAHFAAYGAVSANITGSQEHAWIIIESTAKGPSGPFYEEWQAALSIEELEVALEAKDAERLMRWNRYVKWFAAWHEDPGHVVPVERWEQDSLRGDLDAYERGLVSRFNLTLPQLKWRRGKLEEVRRKSIDDLGGLTPDQYLQQEHPADEEEMFQSSSLAIFDVGALRAMRIRSRALPRRHFRLMDNEEPIEPVLPSGANLTVFERPKRHHSYVIGADISQGISRDWSVAVVLDQTDGTFAVEVAVWRGKIPSKAFGDVLTILALWYNNALLMPEVNGPGLAACARILENRYAFLWHRRTPDMAGVVNDDNAFRFGFNTTQQTKKMVVDNTALAVRDGAVEFRSEVVISECESFINNEGRYEGMTGKKDDAAIAACLSFYGHLMRSVDPKDIRRASEEETMSWYDRDLVDQIRKLQEQNAVVARKAMGADYIGYEWERT